MFGMACNDHLYKYNFVLNKIKKLIVNCNFIVKYVIHIYVKIIGGRKNDLEN